MELRSQSGDAQRSLPCSGRNRVTAAVRSDNDDLSSRRKSARNRQRLRPGLHRPSVCRVSATHVDSATLRAKPYVAEVCDSGPTVRKLTLMITCGGPVRGKSLFRPGLAHRLMQTLSTELRRCVGGPQLNRLRQLVVLRLVGVPVGRNAVDVAHLRLDDTEHLSAQDHHQSPQNGQP